MKRASRHSGHTTAIVLDAAARNAFRELIQHVVQRFAGFLRQHGAIRAIADSTAQTPSPLSPFRDWLLRHRGLAMVTVEHHERLITRMLAMLGAGAGVCIERGRQASPSAAYRRFRPRTKESSDVSHLHSRRNRSSPANRFPADSDRIDTANHVPAISDRLHRPPVSEALKLDLSDLTEDGLLIRETKFQKSRLVPAFRDLV
jgi:hypothetical protein